MYYRDRIVVATAIVVAVAVLELVRCRVFPDNSSHCLHKKSNRSMHCCSNQKQKADFALTHYVHPVDDPSKPESRFKSMVSKQVVIFPPMIRIVHASSSFSSSSKIDGDMIFPPEHLVYVSIWACPKLFDNFLFKTRPNPS